MIIIEGCDRTGKSTLAAKLAEALNGEVIHCGKPKTDDPFSEYLEMLAAAVSSVAIPIYDRFYLGEYVYSKLWRGGCKISGKEFHTLDLLAATLHKAIVIHSIADVETIVERCKREGEELLKPEQIENCLDLFCDIMGHTQLPTITYNSVTQKPEDIVRIVKAYFK